jgi:general secretion pathway protein L
MTTSQHITPQPRPLLEQVASTAGALAKWWLNEFLGLFPARIAQRMMDPRHRNLLIRPQDSSIVCQLRNEAGGVLSETELPQANDIGSAIASLLRKHRLSAEDVAVGIEVPAETIFRREILLPHEARAALPTIAMQDLSRKTPFHLDDIYHDYVAIPSGKKIAVSQWLIKRAFVEDAARPLGIGPAEITFVEAAPSEDNGPAIRLRLRSIPTQASWLLKALIGLTITGILLLGLAAVFETQRQQDVLDELAGQLVTARKQAQQVRSTLDKVQQERNTLDQLRSRKWKAATTLDVWEELSRVLPDHAWLTELRITESADGKERKVVMTGFSAAAADLVALIDKSALFQDVALTAPIAIDPIEQRERFVLQATIRPPVAGASR